MIIQLNNFKMRFQTICVFLSLGALGCQAASVVEQENVPVLTKVFNYQGSMPVKDDRTGQVIKSDANDTDLIEPEPNQAANEAACWNLIVEQSAVTFALQNKVLDELQTDLNGLEMTESTRDRITTEAGKMRSNMKEALNALKEMAPEEYFDALFDSSENIIQLSTIIRDPKLDENVFLALVKAVSRLGRNNSALVQEFTDRCSFMDRSPRPRSVLSS